MNKQEFEQAVLEQAKVVFGDEYIIIIHRVTKNNGMSYNGLSICRKGEPSGPIYNLDQIWEFRKRKISNTEIGEMVENFFQLYQEGNGGFPKEFQDIGNFPKFCGHILYKLINYERNKKLLQTVPYRKVEDLAIVYYVSMKNSNEDRMNITVNEELMKLWGTTEKELYHLASVNTNRELPAKLVNMNEILGFSAEIGEACFMGDCPMYVLSNDEGSLGAAALLYPKELERAARKIGSDLVILPSSCHEVILLPFDEEMDLEWLREMVHQVNAAEVQLEDILSDEVYCYLQSEGTIRRAAKKD